MADALRVLLRTPHHLALDRLVRSVRVLTETGHVGLRPGMEPLVLAVEAGLVVLRASDHVSFAGTAGGLLSCDGQTATLFTPLAVVGERPDQVRQALDQALAEPDAEMRLRAALDRLEGRIVAELRRRRDDRPGAARRLAGPSS